MTQPGILSTIWFQTLDERTRREAEGLATSPLIARPDVLVVGAGLVGLACGYFLAERGLRVQLIDAEGIAGGASGANFGGVWPNETGSSYPAQFQELAFRGRDLWGRLSVRPGFDCDWRVNGFLQLNPRRFAPGAATFVAAQQEAGYSLTAVDAEQLRGLEPALRAGLQEGVHYPSEAHLHPVKAALSLARAIAGRRGAVRTGLAANGVERAAPSTNASSAADERASWRIASVATSAGEIQPRCLVIATGYSLDWLGSAAPNWPLRPLSGQILSTTPLPPLIRSTVAGEYLVCQLKTGEVLTGGNVVEGVVREVDLVESQRMQAAARELLPTLADAEFTSACVGIRPATPDGLPILDRLPGCENAWVACGHHRAGVLLAPSSGELLADWITKGQPGIDPQPFRADRFAARS